MKKVVKLFAFALLGMATLTLSSCGSDDPEESCNKNDQDIGTCSAADITACCDDEGSCYFLYGGDKYSSAGDLAIKCQSSSAIQLKTIELELDAITEQLINEARAAAICQ
ncbi:hypothetical protein [Carboxylicivirga taeanensis]|uniref:hypothetical protein n=1 Tax=Carboxylicivirga taeanensis TaxID=1416875 RepID=UPI003F6E3CF4